VEKKVKLTPINIVKKCNLHKKVLKNKLNKTGIQKKKLQKILKTAPIERT